MNYVNSFDLFGVPAKQIPATPGSGAPTTSTEGAVGCLYMDTDTGNLYKCIAVTDGVYTWVEAGNGSGSGLTSTASELLIKILRSVHLYQGDQSGKITALAAELGVTEEEKPDTPVVPDEPDEPATPEKTLSSISASYSGGDVAVGTAVTDLTGIVVTARYSDGSTATVTGYTLSGTIAEGRNTITVSYGGKTTTFNVTGVAESGGENVIAFTTPIKTDGGTYAKFYTGADNTTTLKNVQSSSYACISEVGFNAGDTVKVRITGDSFTGWDFFRIATYNGDWDGSTIITSNNTIDAYYTEGVGSDSNKASSVINHEYTYTMTVAGRIVVCTFSGGQNYKVTAEVV